MNFHVNPIQEVEQGGITPGLLVKNKNVSP